MRRAMSLSRSCGIAIVLLLLTAGGCGPKGPAAPAAAEATPLKEQMRTLWAPSREGYVQYFLVCGLFGQPAPSSAPAASGPSSVPAASAPAKPVDYLAAAGGDAKVRPRPGQEVIAPDGARFTWQEYTSTGDTIDLRKAFPAAKDKSCVVYAYASIHRNGPGNALMALLSKAVLTVYLNGKVVVAPNNLEGVVDGGYSPCRWKRGLTRCWSA